MDEHLAFSLYKDIYNGIVLIAANLGHLPGLFYTICVKFDFKLNYYHKLLNMNNGDLERAVKELLLTAVGYADSFETFRHNLFHAMQDYSLEFVNVLKENDLDETFLPKFAVKDLL